jgi:hypothetical protein
MRTFASVAAAGLLLLAMAAMGAVREARRPHAPGDGSLAEAEEAVERYLAAVDALYASGGDPRAADRVPAAPDLVAEMLADITFAQHRLQSGEVRQLLRAERGGARWLSGGGAEVSTREFWVIRRRPLFDGGGTSGPPISAVLNVRYDVAREGAAWRVLDYRLDSDRPPPGAGERR